MERAASTIVALEAASRAYDGGRVVALQDVSLAVRRGEHLVIAGPSGSGKSTLLHLMAGLDRPTAGRVLFEGVEPGTASGWARIRARRVGFVFQAFHLLPALTARENVELPMFGVVGSTVDRRRRALALLDRIGLGARASHRPPALSGGERQRVAIARALANDPVLLLADEPTGNLDSGSSAEVLALLEELHATRGTTLVVVSHDPAIAARAARRLTLGDGRITED